MSQTISVSEKINALHRAVLYQPRLIGFAVLASIFAAILEGIGLSFIYPVIELGQQTGSTNADGALQYFVDVYRFLGVPFTLEYLIIGVAGVMTIRYTMSFLVRWLRGSIQSYYVSHLRRKALEKALHADIGYFDREGSDDILNAVITQSHHAGRSLRRIIRFLEQVFLSVMYFSIALLMAPVLTLAAVGIIGIAAVVVRFGLESGYELGDRLADANQEIQTNAQAGTQGIRDVKLFNLHGEIKERFDTALNQYATTKSDHFRNQAIINNFYELLTAISVFVLIYIALTYFSLSLGALGVFLFAIFRLGPRISTVSSLFYQLNADLPHLVRTQEFVDSLDANAEPTGGQQSTPTHFEKIAFENVLFAYDETTTLDGISFTVERGEFVSFVGPSGAGKSTVMSLLARLYHPDSGTIRVNETPLEQFDINEWRSQIAVVRQDPYLFNDTLRRNITVGKRDASDDEIRHVCEMAQVTEFIDDLDNGYETMLGDEGVRLSGGQRQRVALARALLTEPELLLLDEATSDLDTNIEHDVQQAIESTAKDMMIITVAHRLSTVQNADRIYTMEDGRITEVGQHTDLISADGTYSELYTEQNVVGN